MTNHNDGGGAFRAGRQDGMCTIYLADGNCGLVHAMFVCAAAVELLEPREDPYHAPVGQRLSDV